MILFQIVSGILIIVVPIACAAVAVSVGDRPRSRRYVKYAATMGVFAGLAPLSAVIFLRLSFKACAVANLLGLPWPEPWREIAHWAAGAIWLTSMVLLLNALFTPRLRRAGLAMLVWSVAIALPTLFLYFLVVFGDPGPNCALV